MAILYEETLAGTVRISIRLLGPEDLPAIESVQRQVLDALPDRAVLQPLTTEEFEYLFGGNGLVVGAYADGELAGFRGLLIPPVDGEHLGLDIGLTAAELDRVVYQEVSAVLPEWRGNRLQQKMAAASMQQLPKLGREFRYVCCTVAPMNIASMKDKFHQGMEIRALKEKYGGRLRYVFVKDLMEPSSSCGEPVLLAAEDLEAQKKIMTDGFVGTAMREKDGRQLLEFGLTEK